MPGWEDEGPALIEALTEAVIDLARTQSISIDVPGAKVKVVDGTLGSTGDDTSTAMGGDVTGRSNDATVVAIQGAPVDPAAPADGAVLLASGGSWAPQQIGIMPPTLYEDTPDEYVLEAPAWSTRVEIIVVNAGAGGGSGRRAASGNVGGGAGGGSGGVFYYNGFHSGADLTITLTAGGAGGDAIVAGDVNGNPGLAPTPSTVEFEGVLYRLGPPNGGAAGTASNSTGGNAGSGAHLGILSGPNGTAGGTGAGSGVGGNGAAGGATTAFTTGGGGGGCYNGTTAFNGGRGGNLSAAAGTSTGLAAEYASGGAGGIDGGVSPEVGALFRGRGGGGGGGAGSATDAQAGANGRTPGGGGGGGGGGRTSSGAGGDGGNAAYWVTWLP